MKGSLAAEMNYCTVNVNVTSATAGTYTNGPADISEEVGINPPGPATVQFGENADLQIEKTAAPSPATPGTDETFTLKVTNHGPNTAANVVVSDPLPAGLTFVSASPECEPVELTTTPPPPPAGHRRRTTAPGPEVKCMLPSAASRSMRCSRVGRVRSSVSSGRAVRSSSIAVSEMGGSASASARLSSWSVSATT